MKINFSVNGQTLTRLDSQEIVACVSKKDFLIANFSLNSLEWKDPVIYALFSYENKTYKKILGAEEGCNWNECYVPIEVLKAPRFMISLYTSEGLTSTRAKVPVSPSGYVGNIQNENITPDVVEQMNTLFRKYAKVCNQILQDCEKIKEDINNG